MGYVKIGGLPNILNIHKLYFCYMSTASDNSKRIAKNATFLYIRMLLVMGVTLYTSRVILQVLGVEDFGIYNVVGGLVSFLGFFTSSLSNVTQRYLNLGLGKEDLLETEHAFRQSFTLMLILSGGVLILGETIGLWFVYSKLVIPVERLTAAIWVYQFSLLSIVFAINQIPLMGAIIAHERMNVYAYIGLLEAFARLVIAYLLQYATCDSLILYGLLMLVVSIIIWLIHVFYCTRTFEECNFHLCWDASLVKEMSRFIGQNLFGCFAWSANIQGINILLNLFFGPAVNAARAISMQVTAIITRFTENITISFKPQIIKSYASGDYEYMMSLIERSSKYTFFISVVLAIPIMIRIEYILMIWLGQVPEYTVAFTRLVLCEALIGVFIPPLWVAANATGKIKNIQVYGRLFTLSSLPISYLLLLISETPMIPFIVTIFTNIGYWLYNVYDIHRQINLNIHWYFKDVIKPSLILSFLLIVEGLVITYFLNSDSFIGFVSFFVLMLLMGIISTYMVLSNNERKNLYIGLKKISQNKIKS